MKKYKNNKTSNAFKGYASSYNVEISNSFYHELQLKDTESAIKISPKIVKKKKRHIKVCFKINGKQRIMIP